MAVFSRDLIREKALPRAGPVGGQFSTEMPPTLLGEQAWELTGEGINLVSKTTRGSGLCVKELL